MAVDVFRAVADPRRRVMLDLLRDRGELSLTTLAAHFSISRQAATKHLAVLEDAGLLVVRRVGRERLHRLDAAPLVGLSSWAATYGGFWSERLDALEAELAADDERSSPS